MKSGFPISSQQSDYVSGLALPRLSTLDPHEERLRRGYGDDQHLYWQGLEVIEHHPQHWGCIIYDLSRFFDESGIYDKTDDYVLRSELFACLSLLRGLMNCVVKKGHRFDHWELNNKPGPVAVSLFLLP